MSPPSIVIDFQPNPEISLRNLPQLDGNISLEISNNSENISSLNLESQYYESTNEKVSRIPVYTSVRDNIQISQRRQNRNNLRRIKRNNKLVEAGNLPTVITLNPRSLYNKKEQFITLVEQMETDVCFVSETWDRSHLPNGLTLENFIQIEGYEWIQNVAQRKCKGGKPALLISTKNYHITKLCPEKITVPVNVEVVWALLTPKRKLQNTRVKHIAVASVYYSSTQTKKDDILDHISEAYHSLCSMYD